LSDFNLTTSDLSAVAVSAGPGSFTGLRICGSIAKALCFDGSPKMIAVPNLNALAYACVKNLYMLDYESVVATVKAHKDLLYYQVFGNDFSIQSEPALITQDEFLNMDFGASLICGTAAEIFPKYLSIPDYSKLSASFIGELAYKMYNDNEFVDPDEYTPLYIQEFEPKTTKKKLEV
jgi:tRNA threonylcarbamoyladenosine biosynthesis protein TsaB